ncbi:hypothetical protein DEI93_07145 [Curtobacterium sp. MCBD17_035]|uniref:phage tail fiber protein n=1 Tax=Curtobacterium sp. MCBD17_035 TaxID=2175673 RepID=UPI000DA77FDE|nr:hypothetical protein [Curtobacterium sp. MCBD17_035]WIB68797.1 hypothetical protein DEI93_07145 [Curtobacterium sp. MCBD17_035]
MALATATAKNNLANAYAAAAQYAALYTTVPSDTAGTEVTGGAYSRKPVAWSNAVQGSVNATVTFDVPAGVTVQGAGVHNAASAGYLDGWSVLPQTFATAGKYTLSLTFSEA